MRILVVASLAFLCSAIHAAAVAVHAPESTHAIPPSKMSQIQNVIRQNGGCNANVCFAIDGSASISASQFSAAIDFVVSTVALLASDPNSQFAAVQYGTAVTPISVLTNNHVEFSQAVVSANQQFGSSFLIGALNFCMWQLSSARNAVVKIVILGDGQSNPGDSAVKQTDLFRDAFGGTVCAVATGNPNRTELLRLVGGDADLVFDSSSFVDIILLASVVEELVMRICTA